MGPSLVGLILRIEMEVQEEKTKGSIALSVVVGFSNVNIPARLRLGLWFSINFREMRNSCQNFNYH